MTRKIAYVATAASAFMMLTASSLSTHLKEPATFSSMGGDIEAY